MKFQVEKHPAFLADLAEIATKISLDNPAAAQRLVNAVESSAELLCEYPRIGATLDWLAGKRDLRRWPVRGFGNYLIIYGVTKRRVTIFRMVHRARNLPGLFPDR